MPRTGLGTLGNAPSSPPARHRRFCCTGLGKSAGLAWHPGLPHLLHRPPRCTILCAGRSVRPRSNNTSPNPCGTTGTSADHTHPCICALVSWPSLPRKHTHPARKQIWASATATRCFIFVATYAAVHLRSDERGPIISVKTFAMPRSNPPWSPWVCWYGRELY